MFWCLLLKNPWLNLSITYFYPWNWSCSFHHMKIRTFWKPTKTSLNRSNTSFSWTHESLQYESHSPFQCFWLNLAVKYQFVPWCLFYSIQQIIIILLIINSQSRPWIDIEVFLICFPVSILKMSVIGLSLLVMVLTSDFYFEMSNHISTTSADCQLIRMYHGINGYEMSFPLHQKWPTESFKRFTTINDGFHYEICKTNEQKANTRGIHLFYGTRILPISIEINAELISREINRTKSGHSPDKMTVSQMKKLPISFGVFESTGNQIDLISQSFNDIKEIQICVLFDFVWIGTGSFLRSELNLKCKISTWLLKYTVRWIEAQADI